MVEAATIWLVGMMGAGKSAVGVRLAQRLGLPFLDTDAEVERGAGASVSAIFTREGEGGFRVREREAIEKAAERPAVVALGGGAVAEPGVGELLERTGTVVYLRARLETLLERIGDAGERPLLEGLAPAERRERLAVLLDRREPHYARARVVVDTDGRSLDEIVDDVARALPDAER